MEEEGSEDVWRWVKGGGSAFLVIAAKYIFAIYCMSSVLDENDRMSDQSSKKGM